jgi:hypothetical protein
MPNCESIPKRTIVIKKIKIHKLGNGRRANAFGSTLKLSSGPESVS